MIRVSFAGYPKNPIYRSWIIDQIITRIETSKENFGTYHICKEEWETCGLEDEFVSKKYEYNWFQKYDFLDPILFISPDLKDTKSHWWDEMLTFPSLRTIKVKPNK